MQTWRGLSTLRQLHATGPQRRSSARAQSPKIGYEDQFFYVLVRLRRNVSELELAHRLGVHESSVSRMFTTWINFLAYELAALHPFPETHPRVMATSFKRYPNTRIIIDCTEIFTRRPSGLQTRKQLFSSYKHHNTLKFLVGISPSGAVLFISKAWGGRASDKKITLNSGLMKLLKPGQVVMADRGFLVAEELKNIDVELIMPSFLGAKRTQLTPAEVTRTRRIANRRIHVERAIARIKEFEILQGEMSISMLHVAEQIFQVCSWLTNFQQPIIRDITHTS
eukprot:scpid97709/ scgid8066/ 